MGRSRLERDARGVVRHRLQCRDLSMWNGEYGIVPVLEECQSLDDTVSKADVP
jgi:hypothetical protein